MSGRRSRPNILITGTPGTGKSTLSAAVAEDAGMTLIDVGARVKERDLHEGFDDVRTAHIIDEDAVCDDLEPDMAAGGVIVDCHVCDFFPERWFDVVYVLRCSNDNLFPRLQARGYSGPKLTENIEAEIFRVVLDQALDSYREEIVHELQSESTADMAENIETLCEFIKAFESGGMEQG